MLPIQGKASSSDTPKPYLNDPTVKVSDSIPARWGQKIMLHIRITNVPSSMRTIVQALKSSKEELVQRVEGLKKVPSRLLS